MRNRQALCLALAAATAIGQPAAAQTPPAGFSVEALATRGAPGGSALAQSDELRAALFRARALRTILAVDPVRALRLVDPMEARALQRALGRLDDPGSVAMLAWFLRGAVTRIGAFGPGVAAGYYNPLVDGWLIAELNLIDRRWRVADARLVDGAELRDGAGTWVSAPAPFIALASTYQASLASFDSRYRNASEAAWPRGDGLVPLAQRTGRWIESLAAWQQDRQAVAAAEAVRSAIAEGRLRHSGIGADRVAAQIDALPEGLRRVYAIAAAVRRGDHSTLFLISPVAPELLILVDTDASGVPTDIGLLDFDAAIEGEGA